MVKRTNNDLQNIIQKNKDLETRTTLNTRGELVCYRRASSSYSASGTHAVIIYEWGKNRVLLTSGTYPWSFVVSTVFVLDGSNVQFSPMSSRKRDCHIPCIPFTVGWNDSCVVLCLNCRNSLNLHQKMVDAVFFISSNGQKQQHLFRN